MRGRGPAVDWGVLEAAAPGIAAPGRARLEATGVALLGTIRRDGSPRISPVEPYLWEGRLLLGAMPWSGKAHDLARDARCALHSAVTGPDTGEGELKLSCRAVELRDPVERDACARAWWVGRPVADARVFSLALEGAVFVAWDLAGGKVTLRRWTPGEGYAERTRPYP